MNKTHAIIASGLLLTASFALAHGKTAPGIPPDAATAPQALLDSPRHGEWIDVQIPNTETTIRTWASYPERSDKAPVVIVIHEIFGLTDWVRGVADQLAADGFIAVAPDLLSGMGPGGGGTESFKGDAVREAIRKISDEELTLRLNAVRDHALALPSAAAGKSASIGFCWGGTASFKYAASQPGLQAAVVYYGSGPGEETLANIKCPVLGLYGGDDNRVTSTVEPTAAAMGKLEKSYAHHIFEGAGHGFLRQQSERDGANAKAAREAWEKTIAFLREELE